MSTPLIVTRGIERVYGRGDAEVRALDGVDLDITKGLFVTLMGPSGSGKSTMLNVLGCLDVPTAGRYLLEGREMVGLSRKERALVRREKLGFVFQGFNLLARSTAIQNVELPMLYRGVARGERRARALEALASVGLDDRADHLPSELSGGQQQRVAIARAVVGDPPILLADEPTGNLDSKMGQRILKLLRRCNEQYGLTVVMVTHDASHLEHFDRVIDIDPWRIAGGAA